MDKLRGLLAEYDTARDWDAKVNEADNSGNVAGDALARELRRLLNSGLTVAHVIEDYFAGVRKDGYIVDGVDSDELAAAVYAAGWGL